MDIPTPRDLEVAAFAKGLTVTDACRMAAVSPDTFRRWRRGDGAPSIEIVRKIVRAIEQAESRVHLSQE